MNIKQVWLLTVLIGLSACGDTHIHEYETHKVVMHDAHAHKASEHAQAADAAITQVNAPGQQVADAQRIVWTKPDDWTEQAAGGMRLASYLTPDQGDVSIISLGGNAGGFVPNINRWRDQVGLKPASEEEILGQVKTIASAAGTFRAIQLINPENSARAISAAIYEGQGFTLFVKLTGTPACVQKHTAAMYDFCAKATLK